LVTDVCQLQGNPALKGRMMFRHRTRPPKGYQGQIEAMAIELGVDLNAAIAASALTEAAIERMISHCAVCAEHQTCSGFLKAQHGLIEAPPPYCVDRKSMLFLHDQVTAARAAGPPAAPKDEPKAAVG